MSSSPGCRNFAASDLGDKARFLELAQANKLYGAGALREATSLLNAPRRSARGDASSALKLLLLAGSPKETLASDDPLLASLRAELQAAKIEVAAALAAARKLPTRFSSAAPARKYVGEKPMNTMTVAKAPCHSRRNVQQCGSPAGIEDGFAFTAILPLLSWTWAVS